MPRTRTGLVVVSTLMFLQGAMVCDAEASVAAVLGAKDEATKGQAVVRMRRNMKASDIIDLARKEKDNSIVELALGNYLETKAKGREAVNVVVLCAKRRGMLESTAALVSMNTVMADVVNALAGEGKDPDRLAALILANYARAKAAPIPRFAPKEMHANGGDPDPDAPPAKPAAKPKKNANKKKKNAARAGAAVSALHKADPAQIVKALNKLLESRDEITLELAIVAAALLKVKDVQAAVEALNLAKSNEAEAARLYYLARIGQPLPEETVQNVFRRPDRPTRIYTKLSPVFSSYDPRSPAWGYGCDAIAAAKSTKHLDLVHKALNTSKDLRTRIDAARACEALGSPTSVEHLLKALPADDWPLRIAVASALGAIPDAKSVEPLIAQLEEEKGRLRLDMVYALSSIALAQKSATASGWSGWWEGAQSGFKPDPKATAAYRAKFRVQDMNVAPTGAFYDVPLFSDRVAFVLDTSASMRGDKFKSLKENLATTMQGLKPFVRFNVIDFGGHVQTMFPGRLLPAGQVRADTLRAVEYMKLTLGTRTYDGMEAAYRLPGLDTIMFLSDGAPVASKVNAWAKIMYITHLYNRYRPIAIYTVEFEASARNLLALREMAARFAGKSGAPQD